MKKLITIILAIIMTLLSTPQKATDEPPVTAEKYVDKINELSEHTLLPYIRKDLLEEYANWVLPGNFFTIQYLYGYAMSDNTSGLAIPKDYDNTALATYLTYNR